MSKLRDAYIYTAGVLTIPALITLYTIGEKISYRFDPAYTGRFISGIVISENKPESKFGIYEIELNDNGKKRKLRIDCGKDDSLHSWVYGQAIDMENVVQPGDYVEFQVTDDDEPVWFWSYTRNSCSKD